MFGPFLTKSYTKIQIPAGHLAPPARTQWGLSLARGDQTGTTADVVHTIQRKTSIILLEMLDILL